MEERVSQNTSNVKCLTVKHNEDTLALMTQKETLKSKSTRHNETKLSQVNFFKRIIGMYGDS